MGVAKAAPSLGWRYCRRRHLGIKMPAPQVTSGGRWDSREDVLQTSYPSPERGSPSPKTSRRYLKLCFYFSVEIQKSIWSLASPNHSRNGWGSSPLATTWQSISLHMSAPRSMKHGDDFGKHLLYFFLNCTLQYTWIIVGNSVILGRSLVWLETNLNPTMTICCFPRFYRPSDNDRAVRVGGQFDSFRKVWCLGYRVRRRYLTTNIKMVNWPDCGGVQIVTARKCNIKHHRQLYSRLVLPPYTVKIRGGRLGRIIEIELLSYHPTQLR